MKKMFMLTITLVFGAHGGKINIMDTNVASKLFVTATAQDLLELKLQRLHLI